MDLTFARDFFAQNWAECLKDALTVLSLSVAVLSLRNSKKLGRRVAEDKRVDDFKKQREKRWSDLIAKFASISEAVSVVRDFVAIGEGTSLGEIIRRAVQVMASIQAMPSNRDALMNRWVRSVHLEELEILYPALVAVVLDVSRSPTRRAQPDYKRRMELYRRMLQLTTYRIDHIASSYKLRRDAPRIDPIRSIALVRDSASLDEIETTLLDDENLAASAIAAVTSPRGDANPFRTAFGEPQGEPASRV